MTYQMTIPVLEPITVRCQELTAWEFNPQKWDAMEAYDKARAEWGAARVAAFPNHNLLCPGYDLAYPRLQEWLKTNPRPIQPFCRFCGEDFLIEEPRWCCNINCEKYLA